MSEIEKLKQHDAEVARHSRRDGILIYSELLKLNAEMQKQTEILERLLQQAKG